MSKSTVRNQPALESLESRLLLTGGIAGTIANAVTSQAVGGITVNVFQSSNPDSANDQAWDWVTSVQTDALGRYQVSGLDPRHYRLQIDDGAAAANGTHFVETDLFDVVVFNGATTTDMNIRARQAGRITGHVSDDAGNPIAHAQVLVEADYTQDGGNDWHWFETDANGRYDLYVVPTSKKIYPVKILYAPAGGMSGGHSTSYAVQIAPGLYSAPLTGTAGPDFHLSLGGSIHGFAMTADGAPVAYREVLEPVTPIANGMFEDPDAYTDANGEFWIDGVPAGMDIYLNTSSWDWRDFSSNGHMYACGDRYVGPYNVAAGQVLDIGTFTVPRAGTIRGVVTDATGNPIVGADVWFRGIDAGGGSVSLDDEDGLTTDAFGQYRCDWLPPGQYTVQVLKDGWVPYVSPTNIVVGSDEVHQQDVVLQSSAGGVQVSGTITNFLEFAPRNSSGAVLPFNIISYGGYSYNGPEGPVVLAYNADRQWTPADMIQPNRCFSGQANLSDGYQDYFLPSATPAGRYTLTLPTGPQTLQALGPVISQPPGGWWSGLLSDPVTIDGKAGQSLIDTFTIPKGTATISGDITFPAGYGGVLSYDSMLLFLKPTTGNNSFFGRAVGQPDPAGHFVLADIPAGTYYLYAYGLGLTPWISDLITVTAGQAIPENVAMSYGGVVSGTVTAGGVSVAGAAVSSRNTGFSAITDQSGDYQLPGLLVGGDTLTISKPGLVAQSIDVTLAADEHQTQNIDLVINPSSITGLVENAGQVSDGVDNDGDGQTDEADEALVSGATVVVYNTVTGQQTSTTTVAGQFTFTGLASGSYVLGAHADGMTTVTYPGGAGTIALDPATAMDLSATPIILSYVGPSFSVSSSMAAGKLSITFHTDMPLQALPTVTLVGGAGTLGSLGQVNTTTYTCKYSPAAGDSAAQIRIAESAAKPIVPGSPVSKTFGFDVAPTLVAQTGTTFYNAQGAAADMMGAQDNSTVYVPPFALVGDASTSAITLTASRYGDPGAQLGDSKAVTGVYEFNFTQNGQAADVQLAHEATVTLAFKLPVGMTPAEFEATLKVGFKNQSLNPPQWVWNDLANSNPASGISDIRINWASNSITFKASHFSEFAAATDAETLDVTTTGLPVFYTDSDGTKVKVALRAGQGLLHFTGIGMTQTTTRTGITVSGSSLKLDTVTLSNTSPDLSSLSFTTVGGHFPGTAVGAISGTPLSRLEAATVTLDGLGISIPAGAINAVKLANIANGADITMGAAARPVAITCGTIGDDSSVAVTGAIKSLTAARWDSGALTANSLATLTVAGRCGADVTLSGAGNPSQTLGSVTIKGGVGANTWDITGKVGRVTIGGTVGTSGAAWVLKNATAVTGLTLGDVVNGSVTVGGVLGTLTAKRYLAGSVNAASLGTLSVPGVAATKTRPAIPGDFGADLTLTNALAKPALGSLSISGWLDGATITSAGPVGTVKVGGMRDSRIEAHDAGTQKSIGSFTIQGIAGQPEVFINANLSGDTLGTVVLRNVRTNNVANAGADFGLTARKIASYTRWQGKVAAKKASNLVGAQVIEQAEDYIFQLI
jgi:hypothetical protein